MWLLAMALRVATTVVKASSEKTKRGMQRARRVANVAAQSAPKMQRVAVVVMTVSWPQVLLDALVVGSVRDCVSGQFYGRYIGSRMFFLWRFPLARRHTQTQ